MPDQTYDEVRALREQLVELQYKFEQVNKNNALLIMSQNALQEKLKSVSRISANRMKKINKLKADLQCHTYY